MTSVSVSVERCEPLDRGARVYVAGHSGLAGGAIWRLLLREGFSDLVAARSSELDLRDRVAVDSFFSDTRPTYVILAAARVGGIVANATNPADFISDNL